MIKFLSGIICGFLAALGVKAYLDDAARMERPEQTIPNPRTWDEWT